MNNLVAHTNDQFLKVAEGIIRRSQKEGSPRVVYSMGNGIFADWAEHSDNCKKFSQALHGEAVIGVYDGRANGAHEMKDLVKYLASDMKEFGRV
jgi:hypothetical protein